MLEIEFFCNREIIFLNIDGFFERSILEIDTHLLSRFRFLLENWYSHSSPLWNVLSDRPSEFDTYLYLFVWCLAQPGFGTPSTASRWGQRSPLSHRSCPPCAQRRTLSEYHIRRLCQTSQRAPWVRSCEPIAVYCRHRFWSVGPFCCSCC